MGACDLPLMDKVCDVAGSVVSGAGQSLTDGIGAWLAESAGDLAASAADLAANAVDSTTAIDLNASWFRSDYELLLPIGLVLTVGTFIAQLVLAAWRRDERALARAATGTATGVLFSFCAIAFTSVAITVVDALSAGLFQAADTSVDDAIRRVIEVDELGSMFGLGWGVPSLVALAMAIGAFVYWGVMVARKVGVLVLVALAVFAGAGGGWEAARRWRRGWIEATASLVVSKLLMTIVFLIGVTAMGKSDAHDGLSALSDAMAGLVVMVMVLLCPYATYKFVHWATESGGHDDLHRTGVAGVAVAVGTAKTAAQYAMQAGTGMPAPQGPPRLPGAGPDGVAALNPTGPNPNLSKEGIDGTPPPRTSFRFGDDDPDPSGGGGGGGGDRGRPLIQRRPPGTLPPLITRPGTPPPTAPPGGGDDGAPNPRRPSTGPGRNRWNFPEIPPET
jgi:hypothetical protein